MDGDVCPRPLGPRVGCSGKSPLPIISEIIALRKPSLIAVSVSASASDLVRLSEHSTHSTCGEMDNSIISQVVFGRICGWFTSDRCLGPLGVRLG